MNYTDRFEKHAASIGLKCNGYFASLMKTDIVMHASFQLDVPDDPNVRIQYYIGDKYTKTGNLNIPLDAFLAIDKVGMREFKSQMEVKSAQYDLIMSQTKRFMGEVKKEFKTKLTSV